MNNKIIALSGAAGVSIYLLYRSYCNRNKYKNCHPGDLVELCKNCHPGDLVELCKTQLDVYSGVELPTVLVELIMQYTMYYPHVMYKYCHAIDMRYNATSVFTAKILYIKIQDYQEWGRFEWVGWEPCYNTFVSMNSSYILAIDVEPPLEPSRIILCKTDDYYEYYGRNSVISAMSRQYSR